MQPHLLITQALDKQAASFKTLRWNEPEQDWETTDWPCVWEAITRPSEEKPAVKRLGRWNESYYDSDGADAFFFTMMSLIPAIFIGLIVSETFDTTDTMALMIGILSFLVGASIYPLTKILPENIKYYQ